MYVNISYSTIDNTHKYTDKHTHQSTHTQQNCLFILYLLFIFNFQFQCFWPRQQSWLLRGNNYNNKNHKNGNWQRQLSTLVAALDSLSGATTPVLLRLRRRQASCRLNVRLFCSRETIPHPPSPPSLPQSPSSASLHSRASNVLLSVFHLFLASFFSLSFFGSSFSILNHKKQTI